jgi:hypothetical protein
VDGIFHVARTFEDPDITHVEDRVDPVEDMKIIHAELRAKDLERVGKLIDVRAFSHSRSSYLCVLFVLPDSLAMLCPAYRSGTNYYLYYRSSTNYYYITAAALIIGPLGSIICGRSKPEIAERSQVISPEVIDTSGSRSSAATGI